MPEAVDLGYALKLTPRRAVRYFESKGYDTRTWNWWDTWQDAHAKSFTVAKAARLDVLTSVRSRLDDALRRGLTETEFVRNMEPELKRLGWWGRQVVVDADGGAEVVKLGSPHRLKTIYRTNMRTAYAHGHYHRHLANVESRPYWKYVAVRDEHTRPEHAALDGAVFRWDDPFWDTHYPPNGFNCRCRVVALTAEEVKAEGLTILKSKGNLTVIDQEVGVDKRSGEVIIRPATSYSFTGKDGKPHVLTPDPGWNYNPGKAKTWFDPRSGGEDGLGRLVPAQTNWKTFGLPRLADTPDTLRLPAPGLIEPAATPAARQAQLADVLDVPRDGFRRIVTPDSVDDVIAWWKRLPHIADADKGTRIRYANYILPTLQNPLEVWLAERPEKATPAGRVYRRSFIAVFDRGEAERHGLGIVNEGRDGSLFWTFVPKKKLNQLDGERAGHLLYRRDGQ